MSATTPPPPDDKDTAARDRLNNLKSRMQGYKKKPVDSEPEPVPLQADPAAPLQADPVDIAQPQPVNTNTTTEDPPVEDTSESLSKGLLTRFKSVHTTERSRYQSKPWRQLPEESALEYALFKEYLLPEMARGRDIDQLALKLNDDSFNDWLNRLITTIKIPDHILDGYGHKTNRKKSKETEIIPRDVETRALWWLAERNFWEERGRLYDAWQIEILADKRKLQIRDYAERLHEAYIDHTNKQLAILQKLRDGVLTTATQSNGQLSKLRRTDIVKNKDTGLPVQIETEFDPFLQIDAMLKLTDRIFGPLPNMLDGSMSVILDHSLALPAGESRKDNDGLSDGIPAAKRTNAPWLITRLNKVQEAMDQRDIQSAADAQERKLLTSATVQTEPIVDRK